MSAKPVVNVDFWDCRLNILAECLAYGGTEYGPKADSGHLRVIITPESGGTIKLCLTYKAAEELAAKIQSALEW